MNSRNGLCSKLGWIVIALCAAVAVSGPVLAHTDPAGSNSTGITITMTAFLADGTTPALGQDLTECEKIFFSARMTWAQSPSASFEGGTWTITTPDGVDHDVTPVGGIPCIGDSINSVNDPNLPGGRGLCAGTAGTILSEQVPYTVRVVDIGASPKPIFPGNPDTVTAGTQLSGAFAHIGVNDLGGVTASTPISLPVARCVDDLFCSAVICDEAVQHGTFNERLGACVFVDEGTTVCPDNLFCADVECDEVNDVCAETDTSDAVCPDNLFCADVECDEVNDICAETDTSDAVCPDNLFCADVECDEANDVCAETDTSDAVCPDNLFCADVECDEVNDVCAETDTSDVVCPDDQFCAEVACDEANDTCAETDIGDEICPSPCEECDETAMDCLPVDPLPAGCVGAICRTPGFWGTHAGEEKRRSQNITQQVIDAVGGLNVCGEVIDNTDVLSDSSAVEAICVPVRGRIALQLARQLTAAALNCVMSGSSADCVGTASYEDIFAECNAACANNDNELRETLTDCISRIDCLNNGGLPVNGLCEAVPDDQNCHMQPLLNELLELDFQPPGPAGSSRACHDANDSMCTVIAPGDAECTN